MKLPKKYGLCALILITTYFYMYIDLREFIAEFHADILSTGNDAIQPGHKGHVIRQHKELPAPNISNTGGQNGANERMNQESNRKRRAKQAPGRLQAPENRDQLALALSQGLFVPSENLPAKRPVVTQRRFEPFPDIITEEDATRDDLGSRDSFTEPLKSTARIQESTKSRTYEVGDKIEVAIILRNKLGVKKEKGGDVVKIAIENRTDNSYTPGRVRDHGDGTYTGIVEALWPGRAQIVVRLVYTREEVTSLLVARTKVNSIRNIYAQFTSNSNKEYTVCHPIASHLRRHIPSDSSICNFTSINSGMGWYCEQPKNPALSCNHWTHSRAVRFENSVVPGVRWDKMGIHVLGRFNITMRGDLFTTTTFNQTCRKMDRVDLWQRTEPTGFFYKNKWMLRTCKAPPSTSFNSCLRNKEIYLLGDSTIVAWQRHEQFNCSEGTSGVKRFTSYTCKNPSLNLTVHFRFKNNPMYARDWQPVANVTKSHARVLDTIGKNDNSVVVLHTFSHLTAYKVEVFRLEVMDIKKSVVKLINRNPKIAIFIKGPHTYPRGIITTDYYGYIYTNILYDVFSDILDKVVFLNNMDSTDAITNTECHPPDVIVRAMIGQMLSFLCPP